MNRERYQKHIRTNTTMEEKNRETEGPGRLSAPTNFICLVAVPEMGVGRPGRQRVADVGVAGEGFPC